MSDDMSKSDSVHKHLTRKRMSRISAQLNSSQACSDPETQNNYFIIRDLNVKLDEQKDENTLLRESVIALRKTNTLLKDNINHQSANARQMKRTIRQQEKTIDYFKKEVEMMYSSFVPEPIPIKEKITKQSSSASRESERKLNTFEQQLIEINKLSERHTSQSKSKSRPSKTFTFRTINPGDGYDNKSGRNRNPFDTANSDTQIEDEIYERETLQLNENYDQQPIQQPQQLQPTDPNFVINTLASALANNANRQKVDTKVMPLFDMQSDAKKWMSLFEFKAETHKWNPAEWKDYVGQRIDEVYASKYQRFLREFLDTSWPTFKAQFIETFSSRYMQMAASSKLNHLDIDSFKTKSEYLNEKYKLIIQSGMTDHYGIINTMLKGFKPEVRTMCATLFTGKLKPEDMIQQILTMDNAVLYTKREKEAYKFRQLQKQKEKPNTDPNTSNSQFTPQNSGNRFNNRNYEQQNNGNNRTQNQHQSQQNPYNQFRGNQRPICIHCNANTHLISTFRLLNMTKEQAIQHRRDQAMQHFDQEINDARQSSVNLTTNETYENQNNGNVSSTSTIIE